MSGDSAGDHRNPGGPAGDDRGRVIPLPSSTGPGRTTRRGTRITADGDASVHALNLPAPAPDLAARAVEHDADAGGQLGDLLAFLRRRVRGDYHLDAYGFDRDLTGQAVLPVFKWLYDSWFRVEVNGVANVPGNSAALLVANHAGGLWPLDAAMTAVAVHTEHPQHPFLRMLGADLLFATPGVGAFARKTGATLACHADAERLLRAGETVGVWPEGFKGIGKPFRERYKLQRFGRGGFVHAAVAAGAPIVPVSIIGSEEIHPVLGNVKTLARLLGTPYFPLTPTFPWLGPLGLVPLPSKWYIEFGAPIHTSTYGAGAAEDPEVVFDLADRVRETIQSTLYRLLVQRRSVWR